MNNTVNSKVSPGVCPALGENSEGPDRSPRSLANRRVLVVCEDDMMLRALTRALTRSGWDVTASSTIAEPAGFAVCLIDWSRISPRQLLGCQAAEVPAVILCMDDDSVPSGFSTIYKPFGVAELYATLSAAAGIREVLP